MTSDKMPDRDLSLCISVSGFYRGPRDEQLGNIPYMPAVFHVRTIQVRMMTMQTLCLQDV